MMNIKLKLINIIAKLPERYRWSLHNLVAHPLSEIVHLCGYTDLGNKIHDFTIPDHEEVQDRG